MKSAGVPRWCPYLSVNNIEVIYDHVILVLKGVSLQVPQGKIVALLGANGAGKSTTLKTISTLLRGERGDVTKGEVSSRASASTSSRRMSWSSAACRR
jgi:branched-chain amino acid transport system ATP-binding protein